MIKCVKRQSGSRLPSMVVIDLHHCTWRTSPLRRGQEDTWRARLKEHLLGVRNGDVTLVPVVD